MARHQNYNKYACIGRAVDASVVEQVEEVADAIVIPCDVETHAPAHEKTQVIRILPQKTEHSMSRALRMSESP